MCLSLTPVLHFYRQKSCQRATVLILLKCFQSKTVSFAHTTLLRIHLIQNWVGICSSFKRLLWGANLYLPCCVLTILWSSCMLTKTYPYFNATAHFLTHQNHEWMNEAAVRANNLCYMKSSGDSRSNSPTLFPVLLEVSKCCAPISVNINQNIQVKHQSVWRTNLCKWREIVFVLQLGLITQRKQTEVRDFLTSF